MARGTAFRNGTLALLALALRGSSSGVDFLAPVDDPIDHFLVAAWNGWLRLPAVVEVPHCLRKTYTQSKGVRVGFMAGAAGVNRGGHPID